MTGLLACAATAHLAKQRARGRPSQPSTGASPTRPSRLVLQQHTSALQTSTEDSLSAFQLLLPLCRNQGCAPPMSPGPRTGALDREE